ncbi:hypothetical protein BN59_00383 [Legionella massiliensis]|uniref:Uncharacterized protein n=1 Tax=Legionella massiliensis TaxID=1034943 RepID=A0A078KWM6_9GAMM|nr:hypothetical protein [Legionella massiliensis]CDZ76118.1 hypothetical protein BN59_00383 [Legionella massiliensis]CEE11856.1 hypothetical protein BN1094_00383 [Legionella massiliensis]
MKVSDLKRLFVELIANNDLVKNSVDVNGLASSLHGLLGEMGEEQEVTAELIVPVSNILKNFWSWVTVNLPYEQWLNSKEVEPWLAFQKNLAQEYKRLTAALGPGQTPPGGTIRMTGALAEDFHHPMMYRMLEERYGHAGPALLDLSNLLAVVVRSSRMMGYADKGSTDNYPLKHLQQRKQQFQSRYEIGKFKAIYALLGTAFYLIHHYCTAEQLELLPYLIHYRALTTDEERRSETAIVKSIINNPLDFQNFFLEHKNVFDIKSFRELEVLSAASALVPSSRVQFIGAITEDNWLYGFIQNCRCQQDASPNLILNSSIQFLETKFAMQKDQSYTAALDFSSTAKAEMSKVMISMTEEEIRLGNSLLHAFCLGKYSKGRDEDKRSKHSFLSFSRKTKCDAADKKRDEILTGVPAKLTLFEDWALHQGRLDELNTYEKTMSNR